jgi:hypothetical protein
MCSSKLRTGREVFGAHATRRRQHLGRVIGHGGDDVGAGNQRAQPVELRHREYHVTLASELFQLFIYKAAQIAGE